MRGGAAPPPAAAAAGAGLALGLAGLEGALEVVADVEEGRLLEADVHEGRLHAREHAHHASLHDVADDALVAFPFDVELGELSPLEQRNPGLPGLRVDDDLVLHRSACSAASGASNRSHAIEQARKRRLPWRVRSEAGALRSTRRIPFGEKSLDRYGLQTPTRGSASRVTPVCRVIKRRGAGGKRTGGAPREWTSTFCSRSFDPSGSDSGGPIDDSHSVRHSLVRGRLGSTSLTLHDRIRSRPRSSSSDVRGRSVKVVRVRSRSSSVVPVRPGISSGNRKQHPAAVQLSRVSRIDFAIGSVLGARGPPPGRGAISLGSNPYPFRIDLRVESMSSGFGPVHEPARPCKNR